MEEIISFFKAKRNIINTLLLLVLVAALPLGINLIRQQQILRSRAGGDPITFTGTNVEQRNGKWVVKDRNKPITLELISSLGPAGGSGGGGSGGSGNGIPIGGTANTWQSPDMKFQSKVPKDVNQIIAGAGGASDWSTLIRYSDQVVGHMGHWLTPQQANEFMRQRTNIRDWWQKGSGENSSGISSLFEPADAIHAWLPGGLNPRTPDRDALQILVNVSHQEDGQGVSNPDQILAMFPEVKESIISQTGGPEGSDGWPATCFLREWMKIGPNDPNAQLARKVMRQMPGQVGFDDGVFQRGCDRFHGKSTSLFNLMSFIPKGLVRDVYADHIIGREECVASQTCPTWFYCDGDGLYHNLNDGSHAFVRNCKDFGSSWECDSGVGECVDRGGSGGGGGGAECQNDNDFTQFVSCVDCRDAFFSCTKSDGRTVDRRLSTNNYCTDATYCGSGNLINGCTQSEINMCSDQGFPCKDHSCVVNNTGPELCQDGYQTQCDAGGGKTGIFICKPGIKYNDKCLWSPDYTNCYDKVTGRINFCSPIDGTDGVPGGQPPGSGPPGSGQAGGQQQKTVSDKGPGWKCEGNGYRFYDENGNQGDFTACSSGQKCENIKGPVVDGSVTYSFDAVCKDSTTGQKKEDSKKQEVTKQQAQKQQEQQRQSSQQQQNQQQQQQQQTVTTVSYRIAETPDELSSAPWQNYTGEPMVINFNFKDKTPGEKFIFAQFKDSNGKVSSPHSAKIILPGEDPLIGPCLVKPEGSSVTLEISGNNFGNEKGTVQSGTNNLQIKDWKNDVIKVTVSNPQTGQNFPVTVITSLGQKAEGQCSATSQLSVGAKTFCRAPSKHDQENVEIAIVDEDGQKAKEKVRIDRDGNVQNLQTRLVEGKKYKVSIKAPQGLRRQVEFTAGGGTTNLQNFVLPVGDIFPADGGDGKINSLDKAELNRQWVAAQSVSGRSGDFNQDGRVNSIDWACMRYDFGKENDPEATDPPKRDEQKACAQVITPAKNKQTGECKDFPNVCIPDGWEKVASCPKT